jgi:hypothetical protein
MLYVDDIKDFRTASNYVLFEPEWDNDMVVLAGGVRMYVNTIFERGMHAPVSGIVRRVPDALKYDPNSPILDFDVDMEVREGDFITVEFHEVYSAIANSEQRRVKVGEAECLLVRYDRLIGARRGEKVIPLNGYVFAEALPAELHSEFEILELKKKQHHGNAAIVRHVGQKVRRYYWNRDIGGDTVDLVPGDKIYFVNYADVAVEHEHHRKMFDTMMFKIHRKHIIAMG